MKAAAAFTVHVLSVADVLQVAARLLSAQVGLLLVRVQPGVHVSAQLRAGGDAAGGGVPHLCAGVGVGAGGKPGSGPGSGPGGSPDPTEENPAASTIPGAHEAHPHSSVLPGRTGLLCPRGGCGGVSRDGLCHLPRWASRCVPVPAGSVTADMAERDASCARHR